MSPSPTAPPSDGLSVPTRVIKAATRLFAEHGYEATSVQQIVEAAGVTKGALYHYFKSKDDLLAGSYAQLLDLQYAHLIDFAGRTGTVRERLRLVAEDLVRTNLDHLDSAIVYHRSLHLLNAPSRTSIREQRRRYRDIFERLVREGMDNGELRSNLKVDLVSYNFFGSVSYLTVWYSHEGPRTVDEVAEGYADLLISAVT